MLYQVAVGAGVGLIAALGAALAVSVWREMVRAYRDTRWGRPAEPRASDGSRFWGRRNAELTEGKVVTKGSREKAKEALDAASGPFCTPLDAASGPFCTPDSGGTYFASDRSVEWGAPDGTPPDSVYMIGKDGKPAWTPLAVVLAGCAPDSWGEPESCKTCDWLRSRLERRGESLGTLWRTDASGNATVCVSDGTSS